MGAVEHRAWDVVAALPNLQGAVALTSVDEIAEVLKSPDFRQGGLTEAGRHFVGGSVVMLDGEEHFQRRRMEAHLFTQEAVRRLTGEVLAPTIQKTLARAAATQRDDDGVVHADVVDLAWSVLVPVSAAIVGIDGVTDPQRIERFRHLLQRLGEAILVDWSRRDHAMVTAAGLEARHELVAEFLGPALDRRRGLVDDADDPKTLSRDLLTLLLQHWDPGWDEGLPIREASLFLVAAVQTTTQAFPKFIAHLEGWFAAHPSDRAHATDPDFLRRAVYESLRFFVAAPARLRIAEQDAVLASGRRIPAGTKVALMFDEASRDQAAFGPDAADYDPHRELDRAPWGLAFAAGPHACLGKPLVTGIDPGRREGIEGTMTTLARHLYEAGLQPDPDTAPTMGDRTYYDEFETYPVRLTTLPHPKG